MKKVNDIAVEYAISIRALHYYDEIGLLVPMRKNGIRLYSPENETTLKLILLYKESGLSLIDIRNLIKNNDFTLIQSKRNDLIQKRDRINDMINYLDQLTIIKHHPSSLEEIKNPFGVTIRQLAGDESTNRAYNSLDVLESYSLKLKDIFDRFHKFKLDPNQLQDVIKDYYDYFRFDLHMDISPLDFKNVIKKGLDSSDFLNKQDTWIMMTAIESFVDNLDTLSE
jgi:DNA-binding transcriptional MerR regulator